MIKKLADTPLPRIEHLAAPASIWRDPRTGALSSNEGLKNIAARWPLFANEGQLDQDAADKA
jgi:hypothetical protein